MNYKKNKKAYFFTIDAVIGVIILMIGLFFIFGFYFYSPEKEKTEGISNDVTGLFTNVKANDLCDDMAYPCNCEYQILTNICNDNILTNPNMNMMDAIAMLYYFNNRTAIEDMVQEMLIDDQIVPMNFEMQIIIEDHGNDRIEQLYPLEPP